MARITDIPAAGVRALARALEPMVAWARSDNAAPSSSRFIQVGFIEHEGQRCRLFHGSWASQEIELPFGVTTTYGRMDVHDRR